jgi:pimeloyl-ACP methyl ester carboxylesterase
MLPYLSARVLAVDLPPAEIRVRATRHAQPEAMFDLRVDDWARAVLDLLDAHDVAQWVLVGHSLGGLTIAEVARRAPERVAHLVFVSAAVPPEGGTVLDTLPAELAEIARDAIGRAVQERSIGPGTGGPLPDDMVRQMFCNDLDDAQTQFVLDGFGNEVVGVIGEPVSRAGLPAELPKTYVRLLRDQSLPPDLQDELIANLRASPGGTVEIVELDAGHLAMVSRPERLAGVLDGIAARY